MKSPARRRPFEKYRLSRTERLKLAIFVCSQRSWAVRYALPLKIVVERYLRRYWIEVLQFEQVVPHPVYELRLRLGRSSPARKETIGKAVCQAFLAAGRQASAKFVSVHVKGNLARVTVHAP